MRKLLLAVFWLMEACLLTSYRFENAAWLESTAIALAIVLIVVAALVIPKQATAWPMFISFLAVIAASEWSNATQSVPAFAVHLLAIVAFAVTYGLLLHEIGDYAMTLEMGSVALLLAMEVAYAVFVAGQADFFWPLVLLTIGFGLTLNRVVREMRPRRARIVQPV